MVRDRKRVDDGVSSNRITRSKSVAQRKFIQSSIGNENDDEFPVLKRLGLYPSSIKGDGNCLFRSLSDQYYGDNGNNHVEVRQNVVNYMKQHSEYFALFLEGSETGESWPSYIKRMARDGVYGDNLEIVAFARNYKANVKIYQNDFMYVVSCKDGEGNEDDEERDVHIAYHTWEHYSSVRNLKGPHSGIPNVRPEMVEGEVASTGNISDIPNWQIEAVKRSIPYPASEEVEKLIIKLLKKHNSNDISKTVEEILMMDDGNGEIDMDMEMEMERGEGESESELDTEVNRLSTEPSTEPSEHSEHSTEPSSEPPTQPPTQPPTLAPTPATTLVPTPAPTPAPTLAPTPAPLTPTLTPTLAPTLTPTPTPIPTPNKRYAISRESTPSSPDIIPKKPRPRRLTARERKEKQKQAAAERKKHSKQQPPPAQAPTPIDSSTPSTPSGIRTMYI